MDLIQQYAVMHARGHFQGLSVVKHLPEIETLVEDGETVLDYGSGKGNGWKSSKIVPTLYDPAVEEHSAKPQGPFDVVVCTDVMEHVPEAEVDEILKELFRYAKRLVFLSICTRKAKKTLPDGRNTHLTVKPERWWKERIEAAASKDYTVRFVDD